MLATMVEHVIGIDPDRDRVTAAVVDTSTTGEQATAVFGTTRLGYERLLKWADQHTQTADRVWSVEGTGSYGAGVTTYLAARGELVVEFNDPAPTRDGARRGKSSPRSCGSRQSFARSCTQPTSSKVSTINYGKSPKPGGISPPTNQL